MIQLKEHEINAWWTALMRMDPMTPEHAPKFADRCIEELRLRCADLDGERERRQLAEEKAREEFVASVRRAHGEPETRKEEPS